MSLFSALAEPAGLLALFAAALAGLVRGFSGFGSAMVFVPLVAAATEPRVAAAAYLVLDEVLSVPLVPAALRLWRPASVLPAALAAIVTVPLGAEILDRADPQALRWAMSGLILALLALLVSGWRYPREPTLGPSLAIGAASGALSGVAQVAGPPIVAFWLASPYPPAVIRANLIVYFAMVSLAAFAAFLAKGFFTAEVVGLIALCAPVYALSILAGARLFARAPGAAYRHVAHVLIALAALAGLPVFDGLFG